MSIVAVVDFRIRPDHHERARTVFQTMLSQTRAWEGAESIEWLQDRDDPDRWTLYERWASAEHEASYRTFRAHEGAMPELRDVLAGAPTLWRFDPL